MMERLRHQSLLVFAVAALAAGACFAAPAVEGEQSEVGVTASATMSPEAQPLAAGATSDAGDDARRLNVGPDKNDDQHAAGTLGDGAGDSVGAAALQTLGALGLVAMAILATRYFLQRSSLQRGSGGAGNQLLETIERLSLGPQRQVIALRFGKQLLLVGEGPTGMTLLSQQPMPAAPDAVGAATGADAQAAEVGGASPIAEAAEQRTLSREDLLGLMCRQPGVDAATACDVDASAEAEASADEAQDAPAVQSRDEVAALLHRLRSQRKAQEVGA